MRLMFWGLAQARVPAAIVRIPKYGEYRVPQGGQSARPRPGRSDGAAPDHNEKTLVTGTPVTRVFV